MSTPTYVNGTTGVALGGSSVTCNVPTGTQDGDLMVMWVMVASSTMSLPIPLGWTMCQRMTSSGSYVGGTTCFRIARAEPASYTLTGGNNGVGIAMAICTYRGTHGRTPIPVIAYGSTAWTAPDVTTLVDDCLVIRQVGVGAYNRTYSFTFPNGTTEDIDVTSGIAGSFAASMTIGHIAQASAGAAGTCVVTPAPTTLTNTHHFNTTIVLQPAAEYSTTTGAGISVVNVTTAVPEVNSLSWTLDVPAGVQENDVLVVFHARCKNTDWLPTSNSVQTDFGWTVMSRDGPSVGGTNGSAGGALVVWRYATASEPAAYTFYSWPRGSTDMYDVAIMVALRGVKQDWPLDVRSVQSDSRTQHPAITTTQLNTHLLRMISVSYSQVPTNVGWPSGTTLAQPLQTGQVLLSLSSSAAAAVATYGPLTYSPALATTYIIARAYAFAAEPVVSIGRKYGPIVQMM